jgi:Fe-S cluster biogenesis protein NfuA
VPDEAIGCGFHEAVRGVLSHHPVICDGKIANYHPYPPTPWNASSRDIYGTPGPYEDAVQGLPLFEENGPDNFKGIDIMHTVRSFDPFLPCGVHMYLQAHGVTVALVGIEEGVAWLRLHGNCRGDSASAMPLKLALEEAMQKVASDLEGLRIEAGEEQHD